MKLPTPLLSMTLDYAIQNNKDVQKYSLVSERWKLVSLDLAKTKKKVMTPAEFMFYVLKTELVSSYEFHLEEYDYTFYNIEKEEWGSYPPWPHDVKVTISPSGYASYVDWFSCYFEEDTENELFYGSWETLMEILPQFINLVGQEDSRDYISMIFRPEEKKHPIVRYVTSSVHFCKNGPRDCLSREDLSNLLKEPEFQNKLFLGM